MANITWTKNEKLHEGLLDKYDLTGVDEKDNRYHAFGYTKHGKTELVNILGIEMLHPVDYGIDHSGDEREVEDEEE